MKRTIKANIALAAGLALGRPFASAYLSARDSEDLAVSMREISLTALSTSITHNAQSMRNMARIVKNMK